MKNLGQLLPLLILGGLFYLLVLRPAQRRQRAAMALQSELEPGVQITTTGGLFGTVTAVHDDRISLEIAPGVVVDYLKGAVGRVITPETAAEPEIEPADTDEALTDSPSDPAPS